MPPLTLILFSVGSLVSAPLLAWGNYRLSGGNHRWRGLLIPALTALAVYALTVFAFLSYGFWYGVLSLAILNLPLLASLTVYVTVRLKRHNALAAEVRAMERASKPTVTATVAFRALVKGFRYTATALDENALHDVVILLKSGTRREKIADTYNLSLAELATYEKAFDRYVSKKEEEKKGESYAFSPEQRELFLQMMVMSTPSAMGCGEALLWDSKSVTALVRKATKVNPSPASINTLLTDYGLLPDEEETAITKTPDGIRWLDSEYRKIRMSALEHNGVIYWIFAPRSKVGKRYLFLSARDSGGNTVFGIYTKNSGFTDFMGKLAQQTGAPLLYAVVCTDYTHYKNLENLHPNVRLFRFGETAVFRDRNNK